MPEAVTSNSGWSLGKLKFGCHTLHTQSWWPVLASVLWKAWNTVVLGYFCILFSIKEIFRRLTWKQPMSLQLGKLLLSLKWQKCAVFGHRLHFPSSECVVGMSAVHTECYAAALWPWGGIQSAFSWEFFLKINFFSQVFSLFAFNFPSRFSQ